MQNYHTYWVADEKILFIYALQDYTERDCGEMHYERINDISKTSVASIIALSILETLKLKLLLEIDNFYQMQFLHLLNINCQRY